MTTPRSTVVPHRAFIYPGIFVIPKRDLCFTLQPCPLATGPMKPSLPAAVLSNAHLLQSLWGGWAGVSCLLCSHPRFGDYTSDKEASDASETLPLLMHSSLVTSASFGSLGPCFQFILVSKATKSYSWCFFSADLVVLLLSAYSVPEFLFCCLFVL